MQSRTLQFSNPIIRKIEGAEDQVIDKITFRAPSAGDMRGLQLNSVAQGDVDQLAILMPRISNPMLTTEEFYSLPYDDAAAIGGIMMDFLVQSKSKLVEF